MIKVWGKRKGFADNQVLTIKADNLYQASVILGREMAEINRKFIDHEMRGISQTAKDKAFAIADQKLAELKLWAKKEEFLVGGENRLARYLECFTGYMEGSGLSGAECAFLQTELDAGCQSLFVQDGKTGIIRLVHSEEDINPGFYTGEYWYKWVRMELPDQEVRFFAYPGLCSWGPAFGVNVSKGVVQAVDDLYINSVYGLGPIWANAMAFMTLDLGEVGLVEELVRNIEKLPGGKFDGGYAIHLAGACEHPKIASVEFAADKIKVLEPARIGDRLIVAQANCPLDDEMQNFSEAAFPRNRSEWGKGDAELYVEMRERQARLTETGKEVNWLKEDADQSIETGLKILADPRGDMGRREKRGVYEYFTSGFPSKLVVGHFTAYLEEGSINYYVGKLRPAPIEGKEYEVDVDANYRFGLKKIWEVARRERQDFYGQRR